MVDWSARFTAVAEEIAARPEVEVVTFRTRPPVDASDLARAEDVLGARLAPALRDFYLQTDGVELRWKARSGLSDDELDVLDERYGEDGDIGRSAHDDDEDIPFACIDIRPLREALWERDWRGEVWFPGIDGDDPVEFAGRRCTELELMRGLRPFDLFSTYQCMAWLPLPDDGDPLVVLLGSHYVEWDHTRVTDFGSYLEMLLATRGITGFRRRVYSAYRGDRLPPLRTPAAHWTPDRLPRLFRPGA
jgi:hypothetical protein